MSIRFPAYFALFLLLVTSTIIGGRPSPPVHCIWADISSNPGETQMHDGACQQCGTDGQWFDVQGVKCPGCTTSSAKTSGGRHIELAARRYSLADPQFCIDSHDHAYSIGALIFRSKCLRCDTHAVFSEDNQENCKVCKTH
jgi:Zn finger protein HypA/HybF involved in hydrogenase expression